MKQYAQDEQTFLSFQEIICGSLPQKAPNWRPHLQNMHGKFCPLHRTYECKYIATYRGKPLESQVNLFCSIETASPKRAQGRPRSVSGLRDHVCGQEEHDAPQEGDALFHRRKLQLILPGFRVK